MVQDGGVGHVPSSSSLKLRASKRIPREKHCSFTASGKTEPRPVPEYDSEYAKAMRSLDAHFAHRVNIPFERHQFRQAKQEESETADQFVLRLFQPSENCVFGEAKEEHIRDQLIDKCRPHNLRKKLLEASGTLTLQKAREIARSMEAAESQTRLIENDSKGDIVHALEDRQADYGTRKTEWKLLAMWAGRPFRTRPGMQGQIFYLPKM